MRPISGFSSGCHLFRENSRSRPIPDESRLDADVRNCLREREGGVPGQLQVKGRRCLVFDPDMREVHFKLLWLPRHLEDKRVVEALAPLGVVRSIAMEKCRCPGMEHMETLSRDIQLTLLETVSTSKPPYLLDVSGYQSLVLVPRRPPLCLRCNWVGHIRRLCRMPRCSECRRRGHTVE